MILGILGFALLLLLAYLLLPDKEKNSPSKGVRDYTSGVIRYNFPDKK